MSKTQALRKLIKEKLQAIPGETYHKKSLNSAVYPYKAFTLTRSNFSYLDRDDIELEIDLWDRNADPKPLEDIADSIEAMFNGAIFPAPPIYPAFYRENRFVLEDPDKELQHIQLHFLVQLHDETEE